MTPSQTRTLARIVRRRVAAHAMWLVTLVILAGCVFPPLLLAVVVIPRLLRRQRRLLLQRNGLGPVLALLVKIAHA